jgi:hypothetical protein
VAKGGPAFLYALPCYVNLKLTSIFLSKPVFADMALTN